MTERTIRHFFAVNMPYILIKQLCKDKMLSRFFENTVRHYSDKPIDKVLLYHCSDLSDNLRAAVFLIRNFTWKEDSKYWKYWLDLYNMFVREHNLSNAK